MTKIKEQEPKEVHNGANRMPVDSLFYEKIIPVILVLMAVFLLLLIVITVAIVSGIISI